MGVGWGIICMCARAPPISVSWDPIDQFCYNLMCDYRPNSLRDWTKVGGGVACTFARASPVSLSRKPLSLDIETTPKTDLSLSGSLVNRQTRRLTGYSNSISLYCFSCQYMPVTVPFFYSFINDHPVYLFMFGRSSLHLRNVAINL